MKNRSFRTVFLSLTALVAAGSISFAKPAEKADPATAASDVAQAATANTEVARPVGLSTAATTTAATSAQPSDAEMMKQMMELSKLNDNHKLLASMAGTWNYTVKMWMDPK